VFLRTFPPDHHVNEVFEDIITISIAMIIKLGIICRRGSWMAHKYVPLIVVTVALAICCSACSGRPQEGALVPIAASTEGTSLVPVLVATTRRRSTTDPGEMFDGERAQQLSYAAVTVSIPPDAARKIGEVQWPASLPGNPRQNFVTVSANNLKTQSFLAALATAAEKNRRGRVLVFVHGFNNRFDEAVYRFAQIVHDARAPAIPVFFSWPSRGVLGLTAYQDDLESARGSRDAVVQMLNTIAADQNVKEINVLCHSMGCSPTLEALWSMSRRAGNMSSKIKNVLLVAPDVDNNAFRREMGQMSRPRPRFALFLSQDDQALKLSKSIWGGATRLGDVDPDQEPYRGDFERAGVLVFDLTGLRGSAHSRAFDDVTSVMGMIERRLAHGQRMTDRKSILVDAGE
jgi:esterase/lipase superfamily enzyme